MEYPYCATFRYSSRGVLYENYNCWTTPLLVTLLRTATDGYAGPQATPVVITQTVIPSGSQVPAGPVVYNVNNSTNVNIGPNNTINNSVEKWQH